MTFMSNGYAGAPVHEPQGRLGAYQLESELGRGAVAIVYRARGVGSQEVALKVLYRAAASQRQIRELFQREYMITARLRHPGVVRTLDAGEADGFYYMAMALVEGETLEAFLLRNKSIGEAAAVGIVRQVAEALDYVHEQRIVHRDVKPSNILLARTGRAMLFDFGTALDLDAAALYETGGVYGTPAFVAPEQIRDSLAVDGRADLYSLGVVLYRLIAGQKPFYGSREDVLDAHQFEPPPPPSEFAYVSPELEQVILKSLAKATAERYQTGAEFAQALVDAELAPEPEKVQLSQRIGRWLRGAN